MVWMRFEQNEHREVPGGKHTMQAPWLPSRATYRFKSSRSEHCTADAWSDRAKISLTPCRWRGHHKFVVWVVSVGYAADDGKAGRLYLKQSGVIWRIILVKLHLFKLCRSRIWDSHSGGCEEEATAFWDVTSCSPLNVNQRFGGIYRLHIQGRTITRERNQRESEWQLWYVPPKRRLTFNGLHVVISKKIALFTKIGLPH
jgi:hypothetical protein